MKTPRPYQDAAIKSFFTDMFNNVLNSLIVAPVGAGKSLIIAEIIRQVQEQFPRTRIVVLAHVKELLQQNAEELIEQYPEADIGFYCAGLGQKRLHNDITFASIQSVNKKLESFNRVPEIIIIDEVHLVSHKSETQYRKFIDAVRAINPNCRVIGLTGSPFRSDTGRLDEGHNALFDKISYEIEMKFMIEEGYWKKPVCPTVKTHMDTTGVKVQGGDYVVSQLEAAINTDEMNDACVEEMLEHGKDRKKWLVFTAGVQHAHDVCDQIKKAGIACEYITGDTPKAERESIIAMFRSGMIQCLVNVAVLTTGFNVPDIDMLVFMRPTRSPVLYIQTIGRGVRTVYAEGYDLNTKEGRLEAIANSKCPDCLVLDFGNVVAELGSIDQIDIRKKYTGEEREGEGGGEAIIKICPSCGTECAASQRYCYSCSYSFIRLEDKASDKAIVSEDSEPEWIYIMAMDCSHHKREGKPASMKVTYATMSGSVNEWICFEHHQFDPDDNRRYAWTKAVEWHNKRRPDLKVPTDAWDACQIEYPQPQKILVRKRGKYKEVLDHAFPEKQPDYAKEITDAFGEDLPF